MILVLVGHQGCFRREPNGCVALLDGGGTGNRVRSIASHASTSAGLATGARRVTDTGSVPVSLLAISLAPEAWGAASTRLGTRHLHAVQGQLEPQRRSPTPTCLGTNFQRSVEATHADHSSQHQPTIEPAAPGAAPGFGILRGKGLPGMGGTNRTMAAGVAGIPGVGAPCLPPSECAGRGQQPQASRIARAGEQISRVHDSPAAPGRLDAPAAPPVLPN